MHLSQTHGKNIFTTRPKMSQSHFYPRKTRFFPFNHGPMELCCSIMSGLSFTEEKKQQQKKTCFDRFNVQLCLKCPKSAFL